MPLDKKYISLGYLQSYFVDKDAGKPLSGGKVYFYRDNQRNIRKPVYQLVGHPNAYDYNPLPNPCVLGINGTFIDDSGNDIEVYSFPYIISGDSASDDLYYIQVTDKDGVTQFTREAVPSDMTGIEDEINPVEQAYQYNFLTNGQFNIVNCDLQLDVLYSGNTNRGNYPYFSGTTLSSAKVMPILGNPSYIKVGDCFLLQSNLDGSTTISIKTDKNNPINGFWAIEANPMNYFCYKTSVTTGDNYRYLFVVVDKLPSLSGSNMAASCWVSANLAGNTLSAVVAQLYLNNNNNSITITPPMVSNNDILKVTFEKALFQFQVPPMNDSEYNSSGGYLLVGFSLPLNTAITINITDLQFYKIDAMGEEAKDYPYAAYDKVYSTTNRMPEILPSTNIINSYQNTPLINYDINFIPYIGWGQNIPSGFITPWFGNISEIPKGFFHMDGTKLPSYKYSNLYNILSQNGVPMYGYGASFTSTVTSFTVTVQSNEIAIAGTTPTCSSDFEIVVISLNPLVFNIVCPSGVDISAKYSFIKLRTVSDNLRYTIWFSIDGYIDKAYYTFLFDNVSIIANISSSFTRVQVANVINNIFKQFTFRLPDTRAMFFRGVNAGRSDLYLDPGVSSRSDRGDGTTGDNVGTLQNDEFESHNHNIQSNYSSPSGSTYKINYGNSRESSNIATDNKGGLETRPNNIYTYWIIKT